MRLEVVDVLVAVLLRCQPDKPYEKGLNFFILESRRVLHAAPTVAGMQHTSRITIAPAIWEARCYDVWFTHAAVTHVQAGCLPRAGLSVTSHGPPLPASTLHAHSP